jgi:hypothetical protein
LAALATAKADLMAEQTRQQKRIDGNNDTALEEHKTTTTANGQQFAAFTLLSEILLILCLWYAQFYDYRSFSEYALAHTETAAKPSEQPAKPAAPPATNPQQHANGHQVGTSNGVLIENATRPPIGFMYANRDRDTTKIVNENRPAVNDTNLRACGHCGKSYVYRHAKQVYCADQCRIDAWQDRTGKKLKRTGTRQETT